MNLINIFIPSAGLGERLRPITDLIPKPLLPVLGKPVLQTVLERVSNLPVNKIGINLHHKKETIIDWIRQSEFQESIKLFPEDTILGTGGALKNAETFLKKSPFLVHNSDILSNIDLGKLVNFHMSSKNLVTLAIHDYPEFNNLEIDKKGLLKGVFHHPHPYPPPSRGRELLGRNVSISNFPSPGGRGQGGGGRFAAFTGIAVYESEFLRFLPAGISSVVDAWLKAIGEGYKIGTLDVTGCYWSDIGTPASYARAVIEELRRQGEMVYIDLSFAECKNIELDGFVVIEKSCIVGEDVTLRNCILLPGSTLPHTPLNNRGMGVWTYENCIVGPELKIDLKETEILGESLENNAILIGTGGSDRRYYRVRRNGQPAVLMQCHKNDPDFQRHIKYTQFFQKYSVPVPELIEADHQNMNAIFEDLGDMSLYGWLKCKHEKEEIERIYRMVINALISIHTIATEHINECPPLQKRIFDYEHLRWETSYFLERFVIGIMNITLKNLSSLNDEFHRLAVTVDSFPKTIVHRDFQSQNIMITKGRTPRLLDYQGARIGPPAYDVVSLLWDPYYRLEDDIRERLLEYYIMKTKPPLPPETILPCRLQRHMQALGAYGFLSSVKGKKYFLKFIPEGLRLLKEEVSLSKDEYPELHDMVTAIL